MVITVTLSLDLELHNYFYYVNSLRLRGKLFSLSYRGSFGLENNK